MSNSKQRQEKTLNEILQTIDKFLWKNRKVLEKEIDFVIGISRGGLIPAVWIATHLNKPLITTYIDKKDNVYIDRKEWIENKRVLIVDDVVRSGKTIKKIVNLVADCKVKEIRVFQAFEDRNNEIALPWDIYS
jgi:adenine/guanine phosphoribosyltransferase-like PRPP-binding protein